TKEELLQLVADLERRVETLSEQASLSTEKRFRDRYSTRILDALPDMLTVFGRDGVIVELASSPATNHVEGTDAQSIIHAHIKDIIPPDAYESVQQNMEKVIATGRESTAKHSLMVNGVRHYFENRIFPLDEKYLLCMCRDVSARVEMEHKNADQQAEITRLNSIMHAVLNNIPVYLFVKDTGNDFRYLYWNKAFADHSGIPIENVIGYNDDEIFPNSADAERFRKDDLETMRMGRLEYEEDYTTEYGEIRSVVTVKTLVSTGNDSPYLIGVSWDITDKKKEAKELIAARIKAEESDRLKSAFLANMSHEIRTPLNSIVGFSRLAVEAGDCEEKRQYADIVEKNTTVLLSLFNDILDLSALEAGTMLFTMDSVLMQSICISLAEKYQPSLHQEVALILDKINTEQHVWGDVKRIIQILENLLTNSCKFTYKGEIHFGFESKGSMVQFYVQDTGIGIPAAKVATIFERFGKVNEFVQGTGLGLTICRMLVDKMGGRIWVRSQEKKGTTIYFTLPASD
ncbi:MAG: PAS domain-containing sensor histidine kinase, partial [Bacteroides sp.]